MLISKLSKQLLIILFLSIALLLFMQHEDAIKSTPKHEAAATDKPTAFMENSKITTYDSSGTPNFVLESQQALFYDDQQLITLKKPHIIFAEKGASKNDEIEYQNIELHAEEANFHTEDEVLLLKDNVSLVMPDFESPLHIKTQKLRLEKKTRFISTDELVTITKGSGTLTATGLKAWADDKKIELLSEVRGQYVLNHNKLDHE